VKSRANIPNRDEKKAVSPERRRELQLFQNKIGCKFKNFALLDLALTHRSYSNESVYAETNNERLEFLGDSVLGLIVCEHLYIDFPEKKEGYLAKVKSYVVSEDILAEIALNLDVDKFLLVGRGEECSGGRHKKAILADSMEAIMGAYYLDSGFKAVRVFVRQLLIPEIIKVKENRHKKDYKTLLQEYMQKKYKSYPKYVTVKKSGPDHDRTFWINVEAAGKVFGPGKGKNKKEAEQLVAQIAYDWFQHCGSLKSGDLVTKISK